MTMDGYVIGLRLLHAFGGVFWVGAAWMMAGFLNPGAGVTGPGALTARAHFFMAIFKTCE